LSFGRFDSFPEDDETDQIESPFVHLCDVGVGLPGEEICGYLRVITDIHSMIDTDAVLVVSNVGDFVQVGMFETFEDCCTSSEIEKEK
jgi:hypothetical protein